MSLGVVLRQVSCSLYPMLEVNLAETYTVHINCRVRLRPLNDTTIQISSVFVKSLAFIFQHMCHCIVISPIIADLRRKPQSSNSHILGHAT